MSQTPSSLFKLPTTWFLTPLAVLAASGSSVVHAQQELEVVVVTALKRETTLQDTPIAISALTSTDLERIGADDFSDFFGAVPGLTMRNNGPGQSRPIIRGIASPGEPQVGVYFDEALVGGAPGTTNDAGLRSPQLKPFDLERVEVLKGPQGTLYGGGSMGGTIRFITNKPDSQEFDARISLEGSTVRYGGEGYQANAMVNIPLIEDQLALRVVGYKRDDPGFVDNVALGHEDINDVNTEGGRAALLWTPTDNLTLSGAVYYQDQNVGGGFHFNPTIDPDDPKTNVLSNEPFNDEQVLYNVTAGYSLDWAEALYSFSYFDRDAVYRFHNGFTGVPFAPVLSTQPEPLETMSHEFRLSSNSGDTIDWTVGAFYSDREAFVESRVQYPDAEGNVTDDSVFLFYRTVDFDLTQRAIYGEVTWHATDQLALTGGARYYDVDSSAVVRNIINTPPVPPGGVPAGTPGVPVVPEQVNFTSGSDDGVIFKLHLAYDVSDDVLVYSQFSQGFRPGGANQNTSSIAITDPGNVEVPESFESDTLDNYEIGIHTQWMDRRLTVNGAVYYIDWEDIVVSGRSATGLFSFLTNAEGADALGFELETMMEVATDFQVSAAVSYVDSELTANAPPNRASATLSRSGLKGDTLPDVTDWTAYASAEYGHPLPWNDLRGYFYINGTYTGESFADFNPYLLNIVTLEPTAVPNASFNTQGDFFVMDLRFGVEAADWDMALFVENVFDEKGPTQVFEDTTFRLAPGLNFIERPRTFGVVFSKDF